jgi:predicted amidohydrolase
LDIIQNLPEFVDIVVFPESTLNNLDTAVFIPEVEDKEIPCDSKNYSNGEILKQLSCAAKNIKKYIVINLTEKAKCPDKQMLVNDDDRKCASSGLSFYNANIVFDRAGTMISRYRKFNLFENVNKPKYPEAVTFTTDFGVTFGHFICFDLMFKEPALKLVREMNVTDIIFPTMWFSELPFLTGKYKR